MRGGRSSALSTAWTPGIARAADASIERIAAWACGLRTKQACSAPASLMSSTKRPRPVSSVGSSRRATRAPKCFAPMVGCPQQRNAAADDTPKALHCNRHKSYVSGETRRSRPCSTSAPMRAGRRERAPPDRRSISNPTSPRSRHRGCLCASIARSTRTPSCIRWCAGNSRADWRSISGALAASPPIYAVGMGRPVEEIEAAWVRAIAHPIPPVLVPSLSCQAVVIKGEELRLAGNGLARLPVPISTPGFDAAPYLTATLCVTRDPDTGIQNMGTYRAALKATDRLGVRMSSRIGGAGGYLHWKKYNRRGEPMPCAIVVGCTPVAMFTGGMKLAVDLDEMAVAGALAGAPLRMAKALTVDLHVPADAEIVIEGLIDPDLLEPEGPFGESHGHVALEDFNMSMRVTAITHRPSPVFASIISQVTPSESSVLKKVAMEPLF